MTRRSEHGMPLAAITASPTESNFDPRYVGNRTSFNYDSIIDGDHGSSMEDSLFEETGHRTLVSSDSDSVFGYDERNQPQRGGLLPPNHFCPLSVLTHS